MANRGQITPAIVAKAKELLGREITQTELRLMVYVNYELTNRSQSGKGIDSARVTNLEMEILEKWQNEGWISNPYRDISVAKEFYDAMSEIIWLGYVVFESESAAE